MANCKKCGRPAWDGTGQMPNNDVACLNCGGIVCEMIADGYRRVLTRGVAIVKDRITVDAVEDFGVDGWEIDWTDVDRAVREEMGNADA